LMTLDDLGILRVDIAEHSSTRGPQTWVGFGKQAIF